MTREERSFSIFTCSAATGMQTNRGSFNISSVFFPRDAFSSLCIRFRESWGKRTINKSVFARLIRLVTSTLPSRFRFPRETGFAYFNNILNGTLCVTAIHRRKELPPFLLCQIIEPWNKLTPNTHLSIREQCPLSKEAYYTRVSPILHRPVKALSLIRKYFNEPFQEASFQP